MNSGNKRTNDMEDDKTPKRVKKECSYGEGCYRRNPAHFREFSHPHLESILDSSQGTDYEIPSHLSLQKHSIIEQLEVIVEKQLYEPKKKSEELSSSTAQNTQNYVDTGTTSRKNTTSTENHEKNTSVSTTESNSLPKVGSMSAKGSEVEKREKNKSPTREKGIASQNKASDYVPIVPPTRKAEEFLKVVRPRGKMKEKHEKSAPYYIFYTAITDAKETHSQPYSITFLEILDSSLGELKCSLQINFMVDAAWLLAQYYFAGYSQKKLTILYGEDSPDLRTLNQKKPHVDAHLVNMATPFGKHHTKMMILCYEDGSLRVVVSTANLYVDDWENRTQGLWMSPPCPELPKEAMPHDGESPTLFKKYLLKYLNHYHMPQLSYYVERVKRCDFSHINVFLISSAPGGHFDMDWGMTRVGTLLRQHCCIPGEETRQWPLIAQASSLGSYGKEPKVPGVHRFGEETLWLTGDFLHQFTKIKDQPQMLSAPPGLKVIYPSLENVQQSHDGLLGGGCLPYAAAAHAKQPWLDNYLHQWKASSTGRDRAMPHIKSYTRISEESRRSAFYLLTSANVSKAAWGQVNKGNGALRIMSYEAGVLFLPRFVINQDFFPLEDGDTDRLIIPYDLPPIRYAEGMSPWVSDYLGC